MRSVMPPVMQIIFTETLEVPDMFARPYQTQSVDQGLINTVLEATNDGTDLSAGALINVAGEILRPQAQHSGGVVGIANGFQTRRFRVTMVLKLAEGNTMSSYEVVTGYTDEMGIHNSLGQEVFDPNMRLFFNNTVAYNNTYGGPQGAPVCALSSATQLLTPMTGWDSNHCHPVINQRAATLRPQDIFTRLSYGVGMAEESITRGQGGFGQGDNVRVLADSRMGFGNRVKRNSRVNNQNAHYLSRYLNNYNQVMNDSDIDAGDVGNSFNMAASRVADPLAAHDQFLQALSEETQFNHEWSITWSELMAMDRSLEDRAMVVRLTQAQRSGQWMDTESWDDAGWCPQVAQMVGNLLPGMMSEFALGLLHFTMTNSTISGFPNVDVIDARGIADFIDIKNMINLIKQRLSSDIFRQLSNNGRLQLFIDARVSISGVSDIKVSVNGSELKPFVVPHFCDSLFSPVLTNDLQDLVGVANDLGVLGGNLAARMPIHSPQIYTGMDEMIPMGSDTYQETASYDLGVGGGNASSRRLF